MITYLLTYFVHESYILALVKGKGFIRPGFFTAYKMLLIAMYHRRCGRNLRAKLYIAIDSIC